MGCTRPSRRRLALPLACFDPRRGALLLLGGDKTGGDRWYEKNVQLADRIYDQYLDEIQEEEGA